MSFLNVYEDARRADSYARLEFPGTYYLAYRDIPSLIRQHVTGRDALDFGCGAGRSTRFLKNMEFDVVGVDISANMISQARLMDPQGDYRLVPDGDLESIDDNRFDIILCAFTFDNVPTIAHKLSLFSSLRGKLRDTGRLINLVSSPEIYTHEWASFTTECFPENRNAGNGDTVRIIMTDVEDDRAVEDVVCTHEQYCEIYRETGLNVIDTHHPLGRIDEPFEWKSETRISPWCIYTLGKRP